MKRFIIALIPILAISAALFYFMSMSHEWTPMIFRVALLSIFIGIALATAIYHYYIYVYAARKTAYLLLTIIAMSMAVRFIFFAGGIAEFIAPDSALPVMYMIADTAFVAVYGFAHWLSHELLNIKWGGVVTRTIYISTLIASLVVVFFFMEQAAAFGLPLERGGSSVVGRGRAGRRYIFICPSRCNELEISVSSSSKC